MNSVWMRNLLSMIVHLTILLPNVEFVTFWKRSFGVLPVRLATLGDLRM
jgi:hypothetical protein